MADHIISVYPGMPDALFFGLSNLRAACRFHNSARGVAARLERETATIPTGAVVTKDYS
jgi:hypothetical protein